MVCPIWSPPLLFIEGSYGVARLALEALAPRATIGGQWGAAMCKMKVSGTDLSSADLGDRSAWSGGQPNSAFAERLPCEPS